MTRVRIGAGRMAVLSMEDTAASAGPLAGIIMGAKQMLVVVHGEPTGDERRAWRMLTTADRASAMAMAKRYSVPGGIEVTWTKGVATGAPVHVGWRTWKE